MQITKLRLSGFKSFVQPTELLIERGLTGIVGPNGCGKSNLLDALRWAMGENSARGLRGDGMDDVIFAGTATRPAHDLAEVLLHISAGDEPIQGFEDVDELELTRRIGRGLGSVYRVNGKEVRARDVQLLFADAASGARSAAIVSQGRIGALVEAKPQDRRKLLEEAAGIGGLQARRHEAELRLQAADANLLRVQDLLVTLDEQFVGLRKQARQAERYAQLSAAYRETEAALLIGRWQIAEAELAQARRAAASSRDQVRHHAGRLEAARRRRDQQASELPELRRAGATIGAALAELAERGHGLTAERGRLEANRNRLQAQERETAEDLRHAGAAATDAQLMIERLAAERQSLAELAAAGGSELATAQAAETAASTASASAEQALRTLVSAQAELAASRSQVDARRAEAARDQAVALRLQEQLQARRAELAHGQAAEPDQSPILAAETELAEAMAAVETSEQAAEAAEQQRLDCQAALAEAAARQQAAAEALRSAQEQQRQAETQQQLLAERAAELAQRLARLDARHAELGAKAADRAADRAGLDLVALAAAVTEAAAVLATAGAAHDAGQQAVAAAQAEASAATASERAAEQALDRLRAEAAALAALAGPAADGPSLVDEVDVEPGHAEALAAALGDDLLAGTEAGRASFWRPELGSQAAADAPALPGGCRSLAELVRGPAALRRRLAQIGLVTDPATGDRLQGQLAQGQRLVDQAGTLWRWDGFVRRAEASLSAAARLHQQARRRELAGLLGTAEQRLAADLATRTAAEQALRTAQLAAAELAAAEQAAQARHAAARQALSDGQAKDGALAAELMPLAEELVRLTAERQEVAATELELTARLAEQAMPGEAELAPLAAAAEAARAAQEAARAAEREAAAGEAAWRARAQQARQRVNAGQAALEARRSAVRDHEVSLRERAIERAQLEARLAALAEAVSSREARLAADGQAAEQAEAEAAALAGQLAAADAEAARCRSAQAEAAARLAALRDRAATAQQRLDYLDQELAGWQARADTASARQDELAARRRQLVSELADLADLPARLAAQSEALTTRIAEVEARRAAADAALEAAETALAQAQAEVERVEGERLEAREGDARLAARLEHCEAELAASATAIQDRLGEGIEILPGEPPSSAALAELTAKLASLAASRERLGAVNLRAIEEARELELRIANLRSEQTELTEAIDRLRKAISALNREGRERLRAAFSAVEQHFEALFVRLFGGGRAKLELTDLEDPLNAGLELSASPPGKKLQSLSLLSGGEKALTALALIFAVFLTRPSPLCVLDEVDAPLDDANVDRMASLLEELADATQTRFVVVTHHPMTMARMHRLYGVTMVERGVSQLVGVDLTRAVDLRATA